MNIEEVEKIKGLVKASTILSAGERAEWLALFDLMNDKQLLELEKILSGDIKSNPTTPSRLGGTPLLSKEGNTAAPQLTAKGRSLSSLAKEEYPAIAGGGGVKGLPNSSQMPRLSHILNLPNLRQAPFSPDKIAQDLAQKKPSAFMGKLKSMFAEKELPPGHPENELELPEGKKPDIPSKATISTDQSSSRGSGEIYRKPTNITDSSTRLTHSEWKQGGNAAPLAAPLKPSLPIPPVPPLPPNPKMVSLPEVPKNPVVETLKPVDQRKDFSLDRILKLEQKPQVKVQAAPVPTPASKPTLTPAQELAPAPSSGINFPTISEAGKNQSLKDLKNDLRDKTPTASLLSVNAPVVSEQALNSLQDLTKIEAETLQMSALDALVKKIKSLIGKYGYFEVIFNIEKSQAYKSYIATGLKLLSGKDSFDNLALESSSDYLSKAQFEKFTDLLSKIQAS
jgi:hypothetical protein